MWKYFYIPLKDSWPSKCLQIFCTVNPCHAEFRLANIKSFIAFSIIFQLSYSTGFRNWSLWKTGTWAHYLSLAQSKLRLCSANHRPGYWSNLPCDWPSTAWAYSEQETENGPRFSCHGCWWTGSSFGTEDGWSRFPLRNLILHSKGVSLTSLLAI